MTAGATVDGPAWAQPGLDQREGRYPLAVEAPVLSMVATLMPGVSTLTQFARYFSLYWAIAQKADQDQLDAGECRRLIRRSELLLALASRDAAVKAHGADALERGSTSSSSWWRLAEEGNGSYSPRAWGFWSQYGGPSAVLGTVVTDAAALRSGRHRCPPQVQELYAPLLASAAGPDIEPGVETLQPVSLGQPDTADLDALREMFTATRGGHHDPGAWASTDLVRRSGLRILARSIALASDGGPVEALRAAVAYGPAAQLDPVFAAEGEPTAAWRGLLLRHHSVGAWRRLWAGLVSHVKDSGVVTRENLHGWVSDQLPDVSVAATTAGLPPTTDRAGNPTAAEDALENDLGAVSRDVAILLLGARRRDELTGTTLVSFLGGKRTGRGTFLDPSWVGRRVTDHRDRPLRELGRILVDDMLAQSRRVALRKIHVEDGRLQMFSRLHERNGTYTARTAEGSGNVGLRITELAGIAEQLGLLDADGVTPLGSSVLELPT